MPSIRLSLSLGLLAASLMTTACEPKKTASSTQTSTQTTAADTADVPTGETTPAAATTPTTPERMSAAADGTDAKALIEHFDNTIKFERGRFEKNKTSWISAARVGSAYAARARLTNDWGDWARAEEWTAKAFEHAPKTTGPLLNRASINYSLHNFDAVEKDLEAKSKHLAIRPDDRIEIALTRANLAFHRGDLETARKGYEDVIKMKDTAAARAALGNYYFKTGDIPRAKEEFDRTIELSKQADKMTRAWALLQRGIVELDTGNWKEANDYFTKANDTFVGWFLIEEHLAEVTGLLGDHERAREMYEGIVARVPAGEFMEALADTLEALGKDKEAETWRQRAGEAYKKAMSQYPAAVYGHGMDYFLTGEDAGKAVEIARANHKARPGYEAKTRLAQAYIRAGQLDEAAPLIEESLKSGWSTADLHATAARLYTLQGKKDEASAQAKKANALHPEAMKDAEWIAPAGKP